MTTPETAEEKTKDFIVQTVQDHWDRTRKVCMLSTLGFELKKNVPESTEVLGEGLREYLRQNYLVHVVQFPNVFQKIGAVPLSVSVPDDPSSLFKSPSKIASAEKLPIYNQEFWNSFFREIEVGKVRVVNLKSDGEMDILDTENEKVTKSEATYIITHDDLTAVDQDASGAEKVIATNSAIEEWLRKNSADRKLFLRPQKGSRNSGKTEGRLSSLIDAFDGMPESDLARINIPLDILMRIAKQQ
ncbi:hypothetical protein RSK20926_02137 [Roseobacter sp. SK209-2-6]|uniref:hypothetical protein n=1 Tax=Roseobacter sp. SK209-2-6 TaxID=388739 RepID=UPI0000F3E3D4|nr:hypothetical protein [Roseobacter sp. SK209-2-6]EBA14430.1 hypothetical protein RSK20926_02137 [Roseobacter sp. SK209-2-6]